MHRVYVALGSNLDDPAHNLQLAAGQLERLSLQPMAASSIWSTRPEGFAVSVPDFCNAVVAITVELEPPELMRELQAIEESFGRRRAAAGTYESRRLDLDIVDFDGRVVDVPGLCLPHPRAHERRFVLLPLQEISPGFRFPGRAASLDEMVAAAPENDMQPISPLTPLA